MADTKISALTALTGANTAADDIFPIVDTSVTTTKSITRAELAIALGADTALQPADVGTAAAEDVGAFATAAQGSAADTAMQPGDDAADLGSGAATDNYVLTADGAGGAAWEAAASGGIASVADDATPQLGGDLDLNSHSISGTAGTLTTDVKVLDLSVTWNNAAVTFTADLLNVTDTASGANSLLIDRQVNGASKFVVKKSGRVVTVSDVFGGNTLTAAMWGLTGAGLFAAAGRGIGWSSSGTFNESVGTIDLRLERDAAATLAQRNSTNAQTFRLYNTYTDASNYERLAIGWAANVVSIAPEAAGTGSARVLHISGLPTSNPGPGILWNNAGTPAIGT